MKHSAEQTIVITGAGSGIGAAAARLFAARGYGLLLLGRSVERIEALRDELISAHGVNVHVLPADMRAPQDFILPLQNAIDRLHVSAVIINAGIGQYGPVLHSSWEDMHEVLRTNTIGALATAHAVLPAVSSARGSIVFVSSVLGKRAMPFNAAYSASKWALHGFADALRLECVPSGVHIGMVLPARTDTPFFESMMYSVPQTSRRNVPTSSPDIVAEAIWKNITRRRRETVVTFSGKLFCFAGYHFPRLTDFILHLFVPAPETDGNTAISPTGPVRH